MEGLYTMKWDYRFTFGKYRACRVDEVFQNGGWFGKTYIAWAYYNKEEITFVDEILDAVGITDRIEKPGANMDKYYEYLATLPAEVKSMIDDYQKKSAMGRASHNKAMTRRYYATRLTKHEEAMERASSKGRLAWKNQGH